MVFKRFFNKDYRHYRERGEQLLGQQRYAEARHAFHESLQKLPAESENFESEKRYLADKLAETGNSLGLLNLAEAEHALRRGDQEKAREHIHLALEQAEDVTIREKAEEFLKSAVAGNAQPATATVKNSCAACTGATRITTENSHVSHEDLSAEDTFELLVQTLPADLAERYANLGGNFACAYTSSHKGEIDIARRMFQEMLSHDESDILHYELSVIAFKEGEVAECETRLRRALELNDRNPLCYLALVHLLLETGRVSGAVPLLDTMLEKEVSPEQAIFLLGEVYGLLDDHERATDYFSRALAFPDYAKAAAERLIPLMEACGRHQDAAYLFKRYLKGCC